MRQTVALLVVLVVAAVGCGGDSSGDRIAFTRRVSLEHEIFVMNADGTEERQVTNNDSSSEEGFPSWSPDGKQIAFTRYQDGDYEIFVMNADGTEERQLTSKGSEKGFPSWSPDGKQIAFSSDRYGEDEIFVMNADGTNTYSTGQEGIHPDFGG